MRYFEYFARPFSIPAILTPLLHLIHTNTTLRKPTTNQRCQPLSDRSILSPHPILITSKTMQHIHVAYLANHTLVILMCIQQATKKHTKQLIASKFLGNLTQKISVNRLISWHRQQWHKSQSYLISFANQILTIAYSLRQTRRPFFVAVNQWLRIEWIGNLDIGRNQRTIHKMRDWWCFGAKLDHHRWLGCEKRKKTFRPSQKLIKPNRIRPIWGIPPNRRLTPLLRQCCIFLFDCILNLIIIDKMHRKIIAKRTLEIAIGTVIQTVYWCFEKKSLTAMSVSYWCFLHNFAISVSNNPSRMNSTGLVGIKDIFVVFDGYFGCFGEKRTQTLGTRMVPHTFFDKELHTKKKIKLIPYYQFSS